MIEQLKQNRLQQVKQTAWILLLHPGVSHFDRFPCILELYYLFIVDFIFETLFLGKLEKMKHYQYFYIL